MFPRYIGYNYSFSRMFLIQVDTLGDELSVVKYIKGVSRLRMRDAYLDCDHLDEGEYILFAEIDWQAESTAAENNFCITSYGASKITFINVTTLYSKE